MHKSAYLISFVAVLAVFLAVCLPEGRTAHAFTLTTKLTGAGHGTVTSSPAGIDCSNSCSHSFIKTGEKITLKAKADSNSVFTGWSGAGCSGNGDCTVVMSSNVTVTAGFAAKEPHITVSPKNKLDFGDVTAGEKVSHVLKIGNTGNANLVAGITGLQGTEFTVDKPLITVKPNTSVNVKFTITPTAAGIQAALSEGTVAEPSVEAAESAGPQAGSGKTISASAKIKSNDPSVPQIIVPLTADLVPHRTYALAISNNISFQHGYANWDYKESGSIPFNLVNYSKKGSSPLLEVDCSDVTGGPVCYGNSTFTGGGEFTSDAGAVCKVQASGSYTYQFSGTVSNGVIYGHLELTEVPDVWTICCPGAPCGPGASLVQQYFTKGNQFELSVPLNGKPQTEPVSFPYSGTLSWSVKANK
jgi:hypothetical protein